MKTNFKPVLALLISSSLLNACNNSSFAPNCAVDRVDCKQFNPNANHPSQNLPTTPNCAADGLDCQQFNPNLR